MLKVTLKVRKIGKIGCYCNLSQIILKLLKTTAFDKKAFGKRKKKNKKKSVTVKKRGEIRNYIFEKLILTKSLLLYSICKYNSIYEKLILELRV